MATIIAFSGPQGSGKSTLLNAVYEQLVKDGVKVYLDTYKVSRAVQAELGWESLDRVKESIDDMLDFQIKVCDLKAKSLEHLEEVLSNDTIILTERSHADIAAYTRLWYKKLIGDLQLRHKKTVDITGQCSEYQIDLYDSYIYVPFMDHVEFAYDPNRGFKDDIEEFDFLLKREMNKICGEYDPTGYIHSVEYKSVEGRTLEVCKYIKERFLNGN